MTTFQRSVRRQLAAGVVGEIAFDGPLRLQNGLPESGQSIEIGKFYTKNPTSGRYELGGTIDAAGAAIFGGIASIPKEFASYGNLTDGPLGPTLTLPEGAPGSFLEMGMIWLYAPTETPVKEGMKLVYNTTSGAIKPVAVDASPGAGEALIPNAVVYRVPNQAMTAGTVYAAKLTN